MKTCSWPLCVLWYSCFIPRLNFLVSYSSDPSPGIFFVCKHAGRSKDPRCENWNCQLLARFPYPQTKIQIVFRKLLQYRHWSCFSLINKELYFWLESRDTARLFRLFLAFTAKNYFEMRLWKTNIIKKPRNFWRPPVPAWSVQKPKKDEQ